MAKFGQLYLQEGHSGPGQSSPLVPSEWVEASTTVQTPAVDPILGTPASYGYLMWTAGPDRFFNPNIVDGAVWCASGFGGQDICWDKNLGRVSVQQRDFGQNPFEGALSGAGVAMDPTLAFTPAF